MAHRDRRASDSGFDDPGRVRKGGKTSVAIERSRKHSSEGYFETFWDWFLKTRLGPWYGPHLLPTHLEPYASYADAVIETVKPAQRGEIDPWSNDSEDSDEDSLIQTHLAKRKHVEKFSKAENVPATGAWNLVDMSGTGFRFEPKEHHRNAGAITYDTVAFEYTASGSRMRADLKGDRLDYASTTYAGIRPRPVVESLPDSIEQLLVPGGLYTGEELPINFAHPPLDQREVRAAIVYALDHELQFRPATGRTPTGPGHPGHRPGTIAACRRPLPACRTGTGPRWRGKVPSTVTAGAGTVACAVSLKGGAQSGRRLR